MNKKDKLIVIGKGYPKKNLFLTGGDMTYGAIGTAANAGADVLNKAFINKGAHNKVGDVLNTASDIMPAWTPYTLLAKGILKTAGIIANGFTNSVNEQQVKQKSAEIANFANQTSNATDYNQLQEDYNNLQSQNIDLGKIDDWGSAGFLSSGSKRKNAFNNAKTAYDTAFRMRKDGLSQRGQNINLNNTMLQMQNLSAFGGPLGDSFGGALGIMQQNKFIDAINNRSNALAKTDTILPASSYATLTTNNFDAGGFVDNFMQDPVAAAMNYIKQRDAEEAQAEAQAAQDAREQAFADIQVRLLNAETQNQGLQALLEDQNRSIAALQEAQTLQDAAVSPTPSVAVTEPVGNNNTWDYIEGQLRRSGKFNDVQIEGIKYNLQRESALNPYAVGDNGEAFGLGQWHGSRQPKDRSLAGQTQHLIDTLSNYDGTRHWIGRGNYEGFLNARTPEEAHYYITKGYERPAQRILNKVKRDSDMSLRNLRAFGGELGTNGTDWFNGLLQVNAGNTHEKNPFGGVPMGLDPQGIPNLVEEGETVFNDYVFSKRLKVPNFMLKDLGLGGAIHKGKRQRLSFADVSKKLAEESEMRPNDPISMNGLNASLSKLMEIQEAERMKQQAKMQNEEMEMMPEMGLMAACGGKLNRYDYGGALNWLRQNHPEMEHKEQIARYLSKLVDSDRQRYYGRSDTSMFGNNNSSRGVEPRYDWAWRTLSPVGNINTQAHIKKWMDLGATKDEAFSAVFPKKEDRDRLWVKSMYNNMEDNKVQPKTNVSSSPTTWGTSASGLHTKTVEGETWYRGADGSYYKSEQQALDTRKNKASKAQAAPASSSTPSAAAPNTSSARSTARRSAAPATTRAAQSNIPVQSNFDAFREYRRNNPFEDTASQNDLVAAAQAMANANGMPLEVEGAAPGTNTNPSNRRWNVGNYDWLSGDFNPSNTAGFIPYNRNMSADDIAREEGSDRYKAWTDYVLSNWDNQDVQSYLRELDTRAGGNHLFDANGNLREDARDYFQYARGVGDGSNHAWGYYHLTPTWAEEAAANGARPLAEVGYGLTEDELNAPGRRIDTQNGAWTGSGNPVADAANAAAGQRTTVQGPPTYKAWMRYAPAVGAGIFALTDALGITNKPDYTYADKLEAAANRAGYAPNINYNPIGEYLKYNPLDVNFYANQLRSTSAGNRRAVLNSNASAGARNAMLLAQNYNDQNALGNLYRQAEEYNTAQRAQTADFNRRTDMANSQMALEADIANARYRQMASQMGLSGLAQAAAMRNDIDARTSATRSANLSNLFTSLGNIGRENMAFNMINSTNAARNGYWIDNEGIIHYVGKKDGLG